MVCHRSKAPSPSDFTLAAISSIIGHERAQENHLRQNAHSRRTLFDDYSIAKWMIPSGNAAGYLPPSPPTQAAVVAGVKAAAAAAKFSPPLEVSDVRPTDHGPGRYFVCIREVVSPTSEKRPTYSVFYNNDEYKGERQSVILDACENQAFTPIDIAPPPTPSLQSSRSARKLTKPNP